MLIVGCDFHSRSQQIAMINPETGEFEEHRLEHSNGEARRSPMEWRYCNHWQSATSVLRPGTFLT